MYCVCWFDLDPIQGQGHGAFELSTTSEAVHAGGDDRSPLAGLSGLMTGMQCLWWACLLYHFQFQHDLSPYKLDINAAIWEGDCCKRAMSGGVCLAGTCLGANILRSYLTTHQSAQCWFDVHCTRLLVTLAVPIPVNLVIFFSKKPEMKNVSVRRLPLKWFREEFLAFWSAYPTGCVCASACVWCWCTVVKLLNRQSWFWCEGCLS